LIDGVAGSRSGQARCSQSLDRFDVRLRQFPSAAGRGDRLDITRPRLATRPTAQKVEHHTPAPTSPAYRQMTDIIKALMQQLVGVQGRDIARRQTPENTVHDLAGTRRDGAPPFEAD